jgi:arylmalonate decarboxylase
MSQDMLGFGWRARIGFIVPTVVELKAHDFYRMAPEGVGMVAVTCNIEGWSKDQYDAALATVDNAAQYLASRNVDFILHCGAPLVLTRGKGFDLELIERMRKVSGKPCSTSVRAAMDAMTHLGIKKVALATPYPPALNQQTAEFLEAYGFDVVHQATMDVPFKALQDVAPAAIYRFAVQVAREAPQADGLYMPCPQWSVCEVIDVVERDTGKPIVAGATGEFWAAFHALGIRDRIEGWGKLMGSLAG